MKKQKAKYKKIEIKKEVEITRDNIKVSFTISDNFKKYLEFFRVDELTHDDSHDCERYLIKRVLIRELYYSSQQRIIRLLMCKEIYDSNKLEINKTFETLSELSEFYYALVEAVEKTVRLYYRLQQIMNEQKKFIIEVGKWL